MKRIAGLIALGALCFGAAPASADSGTLPGGTSLSVEITSPAAGDILQAGTTVFSGTASVGAGVAVRNTRLVYALDVSGSTASSSGVDCDGITGADSILACERAAVATLNTTAALATSPVLDSGVAAFNSIGSALDVDGAPGTQVLAAPGPGITNAIASLAAGGSTSYVAGVSAANTVLASSPAVASRILVFLSDGADTVGGSLPAVPSGTVVRAFAIGGNTCASGPIPLDSVAASGATGSGCTQVTNLSVLDDVISQQIGSSLTGLTVRVDGGAETPITNVVPAPPQMGPASVTFSVNLALASGAHTVCVKANGTDAGGVGTVSDCLPVQVADTTVNCAVQRCEATATDRNVATANFSAQGITKEVGLRAAPTSPGECGGANCVTGFDVLFDGNGTPGTASLLVVTKPQFSTPFLKASVYLDGTKVTRSCVWNFITKNEVLPCKIIGPTLNGGTFYYVKFVADPGVTFR